MITRIKLHHHHFHNVVNVELWKMRECVNGMKKR